MYINTVHHQYHLLQLLYVHWPGMVLPFHEDKDSNVYLGVLTCLRHLIPNLNNSSSTEHGMKGLRGSFGTQKSYSSDGPQADGQIKSDQLLQVF